MEFIKSKKLAKSIRVLKKKGRSFTTAASRVDQLNLPSVPLHFIARNPGLQFLIDPRDELHVAQPGMQHRIAGEQSVGKRIAQAA